MFISSGLFGQRQAQVNGVSPAASSPPLQQLSEGENDARDEGVVRSMTARVPPRVRARRLLVYLYVGRWRGGGGVEGGRDEEAAHASTQAPSLIGCKALVPISVKSA